MFHKRLLREFKDNRKMIAGMVGTQWVTMIANVVLMLAAANYISILVQKNVESRDTISLFITLFAVILLRGIMTGLNQHLSYHTSEQLKEKLRVLIYEKLMGIGSHYRENAKTSEIVQISTEGVEQLEIYFGKYMPQFFYSLLAPLTLFVIVGTMSMKAAIVLLICVPFIPISIIAVQKFAKKLLAKYWGTYTELGDSFLECLQGLTTLKIYQADERYAKKMDEESEKFRKVTMRVLVMQLNSISVMDLTAYGGAGLGIILSLLELNAGNISLAESFFIIMISAEFFLPLRQLGSFFHIAMNGNAAADKIFRLLDEPVTGVKTGEEQPKNQKVEIRGVSFAYGENKQILKNITLKLTPGLTAIVGESGSGKSTISSLLMGEHQCDSGEILVGEAHLEKLKAGEIYEKITRIRHDSYLFAGTVRENLLMGNSLASEEEMYDALKKVHLEELVRAGGGLDMELLEKASNLSGGQRQRLALARALLHNTDIYIFDEATSNVDVETENDIMEVVAELAKVKTVLLISHRLANVVQADRIYVLENGEITEEGKHQQLYENKKYYYELYAKQKELENYGMEGRQNEA